LASDRYKWLKKQYAKNVKVLEPNCSDWALMIENNQIDSDKIANTIKEILDKGADQIVLGCTHYHWIEDEIKQLTNGKAHVIQPEQPVVRQLKKVVKNLE
jgi:glutamate racemase